MLCAQSPLDARIRTIVVRATPVSRWIGVHGLSPAEFEALTTEIKRRFVVLYSADEWAAVEAGVMTGSRNPRISKMSDTQLIATALGEPAP